MNTKFSDGVSSLIVKTVDILAASGASRKRITKALRCSCSFFGFQRGFVYEPNQMNVFELKEHVGRRTGTLPESFQAGVFSQAQLKMLRAKKPLYIEKHKTNTAAEQAFLHIFGARSLFLYPFLDGEKNLICLVGMMGATQYFVNTEENITAIARVLHLTANALADRVYRRKIKFAHITMQNIMNNTGIDIYVNDYETHEVLYVNKSMAAPYGGEKSFIGKKCYEALYENQSAPCTYCPQSKLIDESGTPSGVYCWDYQRPFDGAWFRVFSAAFHWLDGRIAHVVSSVDITESKHTEEYIRRMANYDTLTNLPNRRKLIADCNERIDSNVSSGFMLFLDLDSFKPVNDTYGHHVGDQLLKKVSDFFESMDRTRGNTYRHGGDEFVILLDHITHEGTRQVARDILKRFALPWELDDCTVICETSIGISHYPTDGTHAEVLLRVADSMLYDVKRNGKGMARFAGEEEYIHPL